MNQANHPATNIPNATQPYHGTMLSDSVTKFFQAYRKIGEDYRNSRDEDLTK